MAIRTTGRNFYKTKTNAKEARRTGEVTVPRENLAGHRIWINKRTKK
jgi:hypothetical protein